MSTIAVIASVVVGVIFLVAGGSKIAAADWPAQARGLGAPAFVIPVLPWIEIVVGAVLVVRLVQPWGAIAALVLLVSFTGLIILRLVEGRRPSCACFGAWSATPLGASHVIRNSVLIALGVLALW